MATNTFAIYHIRFRDTFNRSLNEFWQPFLGFNILKFDTFMNPPEGVSLREQTCRLYGPDAEAMIHDLIHSQARARL